MSKLLSERGEGKYDVLESAKELAGYTIKITSNEKKFPKRYRLSIVNKIQEKAFYIVDCLIMANEIYPNTKSEYEQRILYQKQARAACRSMMTMMEIAASTFNVNAGTLQYWTKMARDVRNHTTAWIKKDVERFKGKFN
ncbi:MAG: hypothetical protein ACI4F1_04500 [Bariatricus sp.]